MTQAHPARALFDDVFAGRISRRELLQRSTALGLTAPVIGGLLMARTQAEVAAAAEEGTLTPTFYDWIINNHGAGIEPVNEDFAKTYPLEPEIAATAAFSIDVFVQEAREKTSTWDVYVGTTPFVEMVDLVRADVIEPWDPYVPAEVRADFVPAMLQEATFEGKMYNFPFLLDVIVQGWNTDIVQRAELDPEAAPATWDEYLANAQKVKDSGAAPFGCTFDARGWRSLAPITHSISTDVYTPEGLFDFTNPAVVQALEIMKRMTELANPDVFGEGSSDGGVNLTPDEGAFGAQQVAYYIKYQNAPLRFAGRWEDPSLVRLAALPKAEGGVGATVFWNTGAALLKYGKNKQQAADYMRALTYDDRFWENSIGNASEAGGQLPIYTSVWEKYRTNRPQWMTDWAFLIYDGLANAKAIVNHQFGLRQFVIGRPIWERYLKGEESDPAKVLQEAKDAVAAEVAKAAQ